MNAGEIVGERIEPHVHDVLLIEPLGQRNTWPMQEHKSERVSFEREHMLSVES